MHILEALVPVVEALQSVGITANIDPNKLNPPCAWVTPAQVEQAYLNGAGDMICDVWLVAADNGIFDSYVSLEKMLTLVLTVIDPDSAIELNAGIETSSGGILPAFKFQLTVRSN